MQSVQDERRDERERGGGRADEEMLIKTRGDPKIKNGGAGAEEVEESLMMELTRLVQKVVKESSWWERRGVDCSILAAAFLCLPPGEAQRHRCDCTCIDELLFWRVLSFKRQLFVSVCVSVIDSTRSSKSGRPLLLQT